MSKRIISVQVTGDTDKDLERIASKRGISKSDVIREVLSETLPKKLMAAGIDI